MSVSPTGITVTLVVPIVNVWFVDWNSVHNALSFSGIFIVGGNDNGFGTEMVLLPKRSIF